MMYDTLAEREFSTSNDTGSDSFLSDVWCLRLRLRLRIRSQRPCLHLIPFNMAKKPGQKKPPPNSHNKNAIPPKPSALKVKSHSQQTSTGHKSGKAETSQPARRKLLVRLITEGTTRRVLCLIAMFCLVGSALAPHHLLQPPKSLQSFSIVQLGLPLPLPLPLIIALLIAVRPVLSLLASKSNPRHSRPLPPNPERQASRPLPKLVKQFEGLEIRQENKESTESSSAPIIQKQVEKKSAKKKPSKQESKVPTKQKTTTGTGNSGQKNNSRQKQTDNRPTQATRTVTNTIKVSGVHKDSSQENKGKKRENVTSISEAEESSNSLQDKETVDCSEQKQRDISEEIADGDTTEETDESSGTNKKKKKKRQRNRRKGADQERTNEKTHDEDRKEIDSKTSRSPTGLVNLGNTCFFNATMQNLNQSFVLGELLSEQKLDLPLTKSMVEFYVQMSRTGNKTLNPNRVFQSLCNRSPRFKGGHQQDSHELLRHLLDGLRNEEREASPEPEKRKILTKVDRVFGGHFLTVYTCNDCTQPYHVCEPFLDISLPIELQEYSDNEEFDFDKEGTTARQATDDKLSFQNVAKFLMKPLNRLRQESQDTRKSSTDAKGSDSNLTGRKRKRGKDSSTTGSRPRKRSRTEGPSILDCLDAFTRTEFITKEYLCMACHETRVSKGETDYQMSSAIKRTLIFNPPALLTLHLKRFTQTPSGFVKCNDMITFPDMLDLSPYCSSWCMRNDGNEKNIWYSLYGVVVHGGNLSGGHYTAYVKLRTPDVKIREFLQKSFLDRDKLTEEKLVELVKEMQAHLNQNPRKEWRPQESVQGTWFYVSDCQCSPVSESEVWQRPAYLLFYERMTKAG